MTQNFGLVPIINGNKMLIFENSEGIDQFEFEIEFTGSYLDARSKSFNKKTHQIFFSSGNYQSETIGCFYLYWLIILQK